MSRLTFSDEVNIPSPKPKPGVTSQSGMTRALQRYSFGLIQTQRQALFCKFAIVLLAVLWLGFVWLIDSGPTIQLPSDEIINSPQPINL